MKKLILSIALLSTCTFIACDKTEKGEKETEQNDTNTLLNTDITSNLTLKSGKTYTLENIIYVKNGATLTIEPGVTIKAKKGKNAIVITRGAKIMAEGTADKPIVFTSASETPEPGDWGGLVILGKATTNTVYNGQQGIGEIEGGVNNAEGLGLYGGNDDNDNSGVLKYARIEYAGYPFQPNSELNSLTMAGVGRGTTISYVQCLYGYDDAFEWFGGTVNCDHLIAYKTLDDDFDTDLGYRGRVQFALAIRDKNKADISGANSFESDNDANGTTASPVTAPIFANITIIGPLENSNTTIDANFKRAAHLRRNTQTSIYNSILMGYPTGIYLDGQLAATNLGSGGMELQGNIIAGMNKAIDSTNIDAAGINYAQIISNGNNQIITTNTAVNLINPFSNTEFNPTPSITSPASTGAVYSTKLTNSGVQRVNYRGAINPNGDTWWKGWTKFN